MINEETFGEHFFDIRVNSPKRGQVIACYTAIAELADGIDKRNVINMLQEEGKVYAAAQVMRRILYAAEGDAVRVCREILEDLIDGHSVDEVAQKAYRYKFEAFYYTAPEMVPTDDPHWSCVSLLNLNEFIDRKAGIRMTVKSIDTPQEDLPQTD